MKSMKTYLIVWLAGLFAGLALMERWQRTTDLQAPGAGSAGATTDSDLVPTAPADQPRGAAIIVAGAKADADRARQVLVRMSPWASRAAPTQRSSHGTSPMPGFATAGTARTRECARVR